MGKWFHSIRCNAWLIDWKLVVQGLIDWLGKSGKWVIGCLIVWLINCLFVHAIDRWLIDWSIGLPVKFCSDVFAATTVRADYRCLWAKAKSIRECLLLLQCLSVHGRLHQESWRCGIGRHPLEMRGRFGCRHLHGTMDISQWLFEHFWPSFPSYLIFHLFLNGFTVNDRFGAVSDGRCLPGPRLRMVCCTEWSV